MTHESAARPTSRTPRGMSGRPGCYSGLQRLVERTLFSPRWVGSNRADVHDDYFHDYAECLPAGFDRGGRDRAQGFEPPDPCTEHSAMELLPNAVSLTQDNIAQWVLGCRAGQQ